MHKKVVVLAFSEQGIQTGEKVVQTVAASGSQVKKCAPDALCEQQIERPCSARG